MAPQAQTYKGVKVSLPEARVAQRRERSRAQVTNCERAQLGPLEDERGRKRERNERREQQSLEGSLQQQDAILKQLEGV